MGPHDTPLQLPSSMCSLRSFAAKTLRTFLLSTHCLRFIQLLFQRRLAITLALPSSIIDVQLPCSPSAPRLPLRPWTLDRGPSTPIWPSTLGPRPSTL